jgi:hypothetical protein
MFGCQDADGLIPRYFRDQPLMHPAVTDSHLLLWYFEDWLKKYFFSILQILEVRTYVSTLMSVC